MKREANNGFFSFQKWKLLPAGPVTVAQIHLSDHWLLLPSLSLSLPPAEAPPSGMSKNGYFFQEMGESESPSAPYASFFLFFFFCIQPFSPRRCKTKPITINNHCAGDAAWTKLQFAAAVMEEGSEGILYSNRSLVNIRRTTVLYVHNGGRCALKMGAAAQTQTALPALTPHCIWI